MAGGESRGTFTQNSTRENVKTCDSDGGDLGHGVGNPDRGSAARRPDDGGGDGVRRQRVTFASGRVGPRASGHDMVVDSAVGGEGGGGAAGGNLGQRDVCGHGDDVGRDDGGGVPGSTSSSCGGGGPGTGLALGGTAGDGASGNDLGGHDRSCGGGTGNDTAAVSVAAEAGKRGSSGSAAVGGGNSGCGDVGVPATGITLSKQEKRRRARSQNRAKRGQARSQSSFTI